MKWYRVNRKHPCRICGRTDWCGYTEDAAICMRVESETQTRNGGWLHSKDSYRPYVRPYVPPVVQAIPDPVVDFEKLWKSRFERTDRSRIEWLAEDLGVDPLSLDSIGCAWMTDYSAYGFPMRDAQTKVIGIRLRNSEGQKWAIKGSHSGIFLPDDAIGDTVYVVEGATDLAAAVTLGLQAIGRPSCLGQEDIINGYVRGFQFRRVVIVSDNDGPGLRGAEKLQSTLSVRSCLIVLPTKDIREFLNYGGSRREIENIIKDMVWTAPSLAA